MSVRNLMASDNFPCTMNKLVLGMYADVASLAVAPNIYALFDGIGGKVSPNFLQCCLNSHRPCDGSQGERLIDTGYMPS